LPKTHFKQDRAVGQNPKKKTLWVGGRAIGGSKGAQPKTANHANKTKGWVPMPSSLAQGKSKLI